MWKILMFSDVVYCTDLQIFLGILKGLSSLIHPDLNIFYSIRITENAFQVILGVDQYSWRLAWFAHLILNQMHWRWSFFVMHNNVSSWRWLMQVSSSSTRYTCVQLKKFNLLVAPHMLMTPPCSNTNNFFCSRNQFIKIWKINWNK